MKPPRAAPQPQEAAPKEAASPWPGLAARLAVGLVMTASGAMKAAAPAEEFALVIESYRILPSGASLSLAAFLPWVELLTGMALLAGYFTRLAAGTAGAMLAVFIAALASIKLRGFELPNCGCFGGSFHPTPSQTLAIDAVLLALAVIAFRRCRGPWSLDNWAESGL